MVVKALDGSLHNIDVEEVTSISHHPGKRRSPSKTGRRHDPTGAGTYYVVHTRDYNRVCVGPSPAKRLRAAWMNHLQFKLPF